MQSRPTQGAAPAVQPEADPRGPRPALYLLCGLLCDDTIWQDVAQQLRMVADVRTIEFRGFDSIEAMAARVLAVDTPRFCVAGHSMGGRVALEVIRRGADRIGGVALLNTGMHPVRADEPAQRQRLVTLAREHGMSELARTWLPPMLDALHPVSGDLLGRLTEMVCRSTPENFAAQIQALLHRPEAQSVLQQIRVPALLLSATGDRWSPVAQHEAMHALVPQARLAVVEHAGHMAPIEQPAAVAAALRGWLETCRS